MIKFQNLKIGDTLVISSKPETYSSAADGVNGLHDVKYPYTFTIKKIADSTRYEFVPHIALQDTNGYGWSIDEDTQNLFKVHSNRKSKIENFYK